MAIESQSIRNSSFPVPGCMSVPKSSATKIASFIKDQFINIYRHCQSNKSSSASGFQLYMTYHLNLQARAIGWEESGKTQQILKIEIAIASTFRDPNRPLKDSTQDTWIFTICKDKKEEREEFVLNGDKRISSQRYCLSYFDGNELEIVYAETDAPRKPRENWSGWYEDSQDTIKCIRHTIYPLFDRAMPSVLSHLQGSLTVIDLGGYSGELSMRLIIKNDKRIDCVYLFDNCSSAITQAKECKAKGIPSYTKIEPIEKDVTATDFGNELQGKADVILLSNMLAPGVLTKEASTCLIKKCASLLKEDGLILVSSSNIHWFSSNDYEEFGYKVLNRSVSLLFGTKENPVSHFWPFYILSRNK